MLDFDRSKWPSLVKVFDRDVESHDGREQHLLDTILNSPSISDYRNNPTALLAAIDDFSFSKDFLISVGPQKAGVLSNLVAEQKPRVVVELGGYLGYSAILFANEMKKANGSNSTDLRLYSLELNPDFATIATQLIHLAGLSDIAKVIVGSAVSSLEHLVEEEELNKIDLLFLDHSEELYAQDFKVVEGLGLLKKGAMVVADNVVRPGAPEYRTLMRRMDGWKSVGVKGLIWPGEFEDELEVSSFIGSSAAGGSESMGG